ncbi:MAG: sigma-54-dependent Fis family transcriptional regulator [Planctomycetaceae bacterium]|nr:sigma-54-dependent Fis family transcriptional regulator [Planctomycetaceae bacterium]
MARIAVIDDDRSVLLLVQRGLEKAGHTLVLASSGQEGLDLIRECDPDVILLDLVLRDVSGLDVFKKIREIDTRVPVIFITGEADSETAIEAMQLGAYDYVAKPLDLEELTELVENAARTRQLMSVPVALGVSDSRGSPRDAMIGRCEAMLDVFKQIGRVASQKIPVLIQGESGTGKELVARAIYQHSGRANEQFMEVNCAALPDTLLESELFGHEKGAFTGADKRRIGKFEQCQGGTIFLDEIGDMALVVQAKVLRLLQEQRFERVGGNEVIQTDVRIVAATNRDLNRMVESGQFRADLLYRLNGVVIELPPLRDRGADVKLLLQHFLSEATRDLGFSHIKGISAEALDPLISYDWPGNIRELRSIVRQAVLNSTGTVIAPDSLPPVIIGGKPKKADESDGPSSGSRVDLIEFIARRLEAASTNLYAETVEMMERHLMAQVLSHTEGNQSRAAEILGITRGKVRDRIATYGIDVKKSVTMPSEHVDVADDGGESADR